MQNTDALVDGGVDGSKPFYFVEPASPDGPRMAWYTFNDPTAPPPSMTIEPIPGGGSDESEYGLHMTGAGYSAWGAGVALALNASDNEAGGFDRSGFDVRKYTGVRFRVRYSGSEPPYLDFLVNDVHTVPEKGQCVDDAGDPNACYRGFQRKVPLNDGTDWQECQIPFSDLVQITGNGKDATWAPDSTYSIQWQVSVINQMPVNFDVWLADIAWTQ